MTDPACPDGGHCHHRCEPMACFRVRACGPLSGVYEDNNWPAIIKAAHGATPAKTPSDVSKRIREMFERFENEGKLPETAEFREAVEAWKRAYGNGDDPKVLADLVGEHHLEPRRSVPVWLTTCSCGWKHYSSDDSGLDEFIRHARAAAEADIDAARESAFGKKED